MGPDVVLQVPSRGERLGALGVGAHEGAFPRVDPPVDVQVLGGVETLATARELALARPVGDVDLLDVRAKVGREGKGALTPGVVTLVWLFLLDPLVDSAPLEIMRGVDLCPLG